MKAGKWEMIAVWSLVVLFCLLVLAAVAGGILWVVTR